MTAVSRVSEMLFPNILKTFAAINKERMHVFLFSIFLLATVCFILKKYVTSNVKYCSVSIPMVKWTTIPIPSLLAGLLTVRLLGKEGTRLFEELQKQYGKIYNLPFGLLTVTVVSDVEVVQSVLKSNKSEHLYKPELIYKLLNMEEAHEGSFVAGPPIWQPARKALSKSFSYRCLQSYMDIIESRMKGLLGDLEALNCENEESDYKLIQLLQRNLLKTILEILVGPDGVVESEIDCFHKKMTSHTDNIPYRLKYPWFMLQPIWKLHPTSLKVQMEAGNIRKIVDEKIATYREINHAHSDNPPYMLGIMLKKKWAGKELSDNFSTTLLAERETLFIALQCTLFMLAKHPRIQDKCYQEIAQVFSSNGQNKTASIQNLNQLKYLGRCIMESMRILPPISSFGRTIRSPLTIKPGFTLKSGTNILISAWMVHRDPQYYPNPECFDPDRFLPEKIRERPACSYIPFSFGPRNCPAMRMSMLQLKLSISWILKYYEIRSNCRIEDVNFISGVRIIPDKSFGLSLRRRAQMHENIN